MKHERPGIYRCKVCGALWQLVPPSYPSHCGPNGDRECLCRTGWWTCLTLDVMGKCCDNEVMGDQIVPINIVPLGG